MRRGRSASPPVKTPGPSYPREGRRRLDHAVLISARKFIKKQYERGIQPTDEDEVIELMRQVIQEKYISNYDTLVEDFETMHEHRRPNAREVTVLEDRAERLAIDEVEHEVAQESIEYSGVGHNPELTRAPQGRGSRFERRELRALANEPPPAPNDIASLIADFSEQSKTLAPKTRSSSSGKKR